MGNLLANSESNVGTSSNKVSLRYEQEKLVFQKDNLLFDLYDGYDKDTGQPISIFHFASNKLNANHLTSLARNSVSRAKTIMIPETLKFIASEETGLGIFLVTERVIPLSSILETLSAEEKVIGVFQIIKALSFLHTTAKIEHNNLCVDSIFVNPSDLADWKLGGFEFAFPTNSQESFELLKATQSFQNAKAIPPEHTLNTDVSDTWPVGARDSWALGVLISEHLNLPSSNELSDLIAKMKSSPHTRPEMSALLNSSYFTKEHSYANLHRLLKEFPLRSPQETRIFFQDLFSSLKRLPRDLLCKTFLHKLKKYHVLVDSEAQCFLPHFFTIKHSNPNVEGLLDVDEWKKHMEDFVLWSFSQRDRRLRIVLLNNLEYYINAFSIAQIEETIVPELIAGLRDRDENLVTETLKAMHTLFQHLSKFNEGDKVRENLLICLIEVARDYPIEEIRINAFIRLGLLFQLTKCLEKYVVDWFLTGVKSPNECIRLLAVSFVTTAVMTQFDYDIDQKIVSFLLPTLSPLLTDSNSEVREQSYLAICEAAAEVLRRRGHTNLNAIQTRHITLSDIPSLSSSKEKRRNIATKKQTEVTSSSKPCDKTTVQENIKVEVTSSSWNSQFDKLSETESNSLSVATTVPSSVATPAMSTTATTLDTEEKSLKRMGQMQSVPSKMNSDETKIETRETSERDDERDIFVEFGMRPQVKAAPRLHTPPTLAVSASLSEEKTTIPSMSAPTPMKTTSSLSTRLHQVEDVDDFAQRWVDEDWDVELQAVIRNEPSEESRNTSETTPLSESKTKEQNSSMPSSSRLLETPVALPVSREPQLQTEKTEMPQSISIVTSEVATRSQDLTNAMQEKPRKQEQNSPHSKAVLKKQKPQIERMSLDFDDSDE